MCILELNANGVTFSDIRQYFRYIQGEMNTSRIGVEIVPSSFFTPTWAEGKDISQGYGGEWYKSQRTLILEVKSAVLPTEANYLINTTHSGFSGLAFSAPLQVPLDPRIK